MTDINGDDVASRYVHQISWVYGEKAAVRLVILVSLALKWKKGETLLKTVGKKSFSIKKH